MIQAGSADDCSAGQPAEPDPNCSICPRLVTFRSKAERAEPNWFNGAVASFGDTNARLLIVGLAPGMGGANRTGRPFTGDFAGALLYGALDQYGFSRGVFDARADDGLELVDAMITNAVRCVPPQNKPTAEEINSCRPFLKARIAQLPRLQIIVCLGKISHDSVVRALGQRLTIYQFQHGARHRVGKLTIFDSYHCSRYNTQTKRLTPEMFYAVFAAIREELA